MKTTQEKIAVMAAHLDGAEVEREGGFFDWGLDRNPSWNWDTYNYRIKSKVDEYQHLKDALKEGKRLRCKGNDEWGRWCNQDETAWTFIYPPEHYEIETDKVPLDQEDMRQVFEVKVKRGDYPSHRLASYHDKYFTTASWSVIRYKEAMENGWLWRGITGDWKPMHKGAGE